MGVGIAEEEMTGLMVLKVFMLPVKVESSKMICGTEVTESSSHEAKQLGQCGDDAGKQNFQEQVRSRTGPGPWHKKDK